MPAVPPLDLRQALYFVAVARELNFRRAAEQLHISAPALSQQIKALERHLGMQLLVRDTRHVQLTAAGEVFAQSSQRLLDAAEFAVAQARSTAGVHQGQLVLASLLDAELAFEPVLTEFHAAFPHIQFELPRMGHVELLAALLDRRADAALTWTHLLDRSSHRNGLRWVAVAATEMVAALRRDHPLTARDHVPRGEVLRDTPTVLFERAYSPISFDYVVDELYGAGCADPPVREVSVTVRVQEALVRQVASTGALAPLMRPVADVFRADLVTRPFDPPWFMEGRLVWRHDNRSAAQIAFMAASGLSRPTPS